METKDKVLKVMQDEAKPLKAGEIANISGIDKNNVTKCIKELKNEDKIFSPKRCFYQAK